MDFDLDFAHVATGNTCFGSVTSSFLSISFSYLANLNNSNVVQSNLQPFKSFQGHNLLASGETVDSQGHAGLSSVDLYAGRTSPPGSACSLKLNHTSGHLTCVSVPGACLFHPSCIS